jgi:hypothetical protein
MGLSDKNGIVFDMDLLALKPALSKGRTIAISPEPILSGTLKPWPLSYAPVIAITDSILIVQKFVSL